MMGLEQVPQKVLLTDNSLVLISQQDDISEDVHTPAIEFYKDCFSVLKDKGSVKKKNEFFEESLYHLGIIK